MGSATTAACKVVSSSTLIGPFEFERGRERVLNLSARSNFKWTNQTKQRMKRPCELPLSWTLSQASQERKRGTFKAIFLFFTSLSIAEAHVFKVKFVGLYGTVSFIAIRDFSF